MYLDRIMPCAYGSPAPLPALLSPSMPWGAANAAVPITTAKRGGASFGPLGGSELLLLLLLLLILLLLLLLLLL